LIETLNKEAQATDPAGIRNYSEDLIHLLPGVRSAGAAYTDSLTDRLATTEMMARHGNQKLISEIEIANAFNDLMRQTGAPASLKADLNSVEMARRGWEKEIPTLISLEKNGTNCYPGEAIWVLTILIANVEAHYPPFPPGESRMVSGYRPPAELHLAQYFSSHSPREAAHILDRLAVRLGI
jgi:hypothetical protein